MKIEQILALEMTPAEHFHDLNGFEWTLSLSIADRQTMRDNFLDCIRQAMESIAPDAESAWRQFDQIVYEWKATANVLADPELSRRLLEDWSAKDEVNPTVGLGPKGLRANLGEVHFAASCSASPISGLVTKKRTAAIGLS